MIDTIQSLWKQDKLPIIDGLYKSNGMYYKLTDNKVVIAELSKKDYFDWCSDISIHVKIEYQGIIYCCGEGSWGSDGYIIAIKNNIVEWLFFGDLNPIEKIWIDNNEIHAINNCKAEWIIPIFEPENAHITLV